MTPSLWARARRSLAYRGPIRTLQLAARWLADRLRHGPRAPRRHAFDIEFGLDTVSVEFGSALAGDGAFGNSHQPVDTVQFAEAMALLPADELSTLDFVDFGSGQGRALLLAADYPFRRILGIEHSRQLHELARANIAHYRGPRQRCHDIESRWADAAACEVPTAPAVFYFYQPFQPPLLEAVIGRLLASLRQAPRPLYILYLGDPSPLWQRAGAFDTIASRDDATLYRHALPTILV